MENVRNVLITGCSSGIGFATAILLKQSGYRVFATVRKEDDYQRLKNLGFDVLYLELSSPSSIHTAVQEFLKLTNENIYALINNAGYLQLGAIEDLNNEYIEQQFKVNVFGQIELVHLLLPYFRKQNTAHIVQLSSILGFIPLPLYSAYVASKFALEGFISCLRQELIDTDIHVSLINPGSTYTKFHKNAFKYYQSAINPRTSNFQKSYSKIEKQYFVDNPKNKLSAEKIAMRISKILSAKHPNKNNYIGVKTLLCKVVRKLLPESIIDFIIAKISL